MAQMDINIDNLTYCGKEASEIMAKQVYNLDLTSYGITLKDNVKGKEKVYSGELAEGLWQKYTCAFSPNGSASLAEFYIETDAIKVNLEICVDALWDTYMIEYTKITLDGGIPTPFSEWLFKRLLEQMNIEYQEMFWKGDKALSGDTGNTKPHLANTDGIEKKLKAGAVTGTTTQFTVANILTQVEAAAMAAIELAGTQNFNIEPYRIFLNKTDVKLLEVALGKQNVVENLNSAVFANYSRNNGRINVLGMDVYPTEQTRSGIIVADARNLVLGFDTFDSHNEYRIIKMIETTGDDMVRIVAKSNIGTCVVFPELAIYQYKA